MAGIEDLQRLVTLDNGLAGFSTVRPDGTVQSTVVNAGVVDCPVAPFAGAVSAGAARPAGVVVKLRCADHVPPAPVVVLPARTSQ